MRLLGRSLVGMALLAAVLAQTACMDVLSQHNARGRVAVLDLDRLAEELGFKTQIQAALKEVEDGLNNELKTARERVQKALVERRNQYGQTPSVAQQRELRAVAEQSRRELVQLRNSSAESLNSRRELFVAQLKDHVRTIASDVARERYMDIVFLRTTNMLVAHPDSDITDAVVAKVRAGAPKLELSVPKSTK